MNVGLREHFATVFRHWGVVTTIVITSLLVAGGVAFLSSKAYVADSRVLVLSRSKVERATKSNFSEAAASTPQEQVLTQVAIVKSPLLAMRLAEEIGPQRVVEEMTWRWDWLRKLPGKAKDKIILSLNGWGPTSSLLATVGIKIPGGGPSGPPLNDATELIMDGLIVEGITKTDMFVIGFEAPGPEFAAEVVNGLVDIYIDHVVDLRSPAGTAEIAQAEAARLQADLNAAETELATFAKDNNIFSIDRQKSLLLDRVASIQTELANSERAVLEAQQKIAAIETRMTALPMAGSVSVTTRPDPVVDQLRERLSVLQTEVQRFVPGSQSEARLRTEIRSIENQLANMSNIIEGSETKGENALMQQFQSTLALQQAELQALNVRGDFHARQLETAESELRRLESHEMRYRALQRNVETKEQAYRFAVQEREETAIAKVLTEANFAQVVRVEPATAPADPTTPRRGLLLGLGFAVGVMAGIAVAYILEFNRKTMSTPRETELALGVRVLAVIDRLGLLVRRSKRNEIEYRRFATWLANRREEGETTILAISSAHKNVAQTDVVEETAKALHQQHANVLKLTVRYAEEDRPWVQLPAEADPDEPPVLHAGQIKAQPWDIASEVEKARDEIAENYGFVLVDLPSAEDFPEQFHVVKTIGSVMLLIEADRTKVQPTADLIDQYRDAGAEVVGAILNNRRAKTSSWAFSWMAETRRRARERSTASA